MPKFPYKMLSEVHMLHLFMSCVIRKHVTNHFQTPPQTYTSVCTFAQQQSDHLHYASSLRKAKRLTSPSANCTMLTLIL